MRGDGVVLHMLAELQSIHHRHHHVAHNKVGHLLAGHLKAFLPIGSLAHLILPLQNGAQIGADIGIVVDDEQAGLLTIVGCHSAGCGL